MTSQPLVSIACLTFNHEKYIKEALDSFLMQKTSFEFEIVIGDGGSWDNNRQIILDYKNKYPEKIIPVFPEQDPGIPETYNLIFDNCRGKYIATCEGDDYWTDKNKLQEQINFLEKNPDFSICHHNVLIMDNETGKISKKYVPLKEVTDIIDLAYHNHLFTPACVFRNNNVRLPSELNNLPIADYPLHLFNAKYGRIKYFRNCMAVYRVHKQGVWNGETLINNFSNALKVYEFLVKQDFPDQVIQIFKQSILFLHTRIIDQLISENKKDDVATYLLKLSPETQVELFINSRKSIASFVNKKLFIFKRILFSKLKNNMFHRYILHKNWVRAIK